MATENVEAASGSGGPRFATDTETVGTTTVNHPLTKIEWGPEDSFTLVNTGTASLPIQGAAAENAAAAANPILAGGRYDSAARTLGNGDVGALALNASGHALVDTGTVTITGTVVPNGTVTTVPSGTQAVSGTLSVNSHEVTNGGTFATQIDGDALTSLQLIDNIVLTEDTAHNSGDSGVMPLAVRNDTLASRVSLDGDYAPLQVDADGALYTKPTGTLSVAVAAALPAGSNQIGKLAANSGVDIGDVDVTSQDGVAAEGSALNNGILIQGDDGTDRKNINVDPTTGDVQVDVTNTVTVAGTLTATPSGTQTVSGTLTVGAALPAGSNAIGKLAANSGVDIGDVDVTSLPQPTSHYRNIDANAEDAIKGSAGTLHWLHAINLTASVAYLHLYDATAASVTPGTTTPDFTFPIPTVGDTNGAGFNLPLGGSGQSFANAITMVCTTTLDGSAGDPGTNGVVINAGYA